ncbi:ABC transporter substrate-binding protein [Hoeflea sp. YIM 152468]|uniref:ABC transporter substrate-binding protein n=1 Tax=Hoeflea sp. YIM 152468 TaxID=3031759 RepID=UPI0023DCB7AF|nr:ABC transporter substrate-binding protein [Hoeflea sp. YIM 152468]MDF1610413.1 ABC transporter substrate-binding protein [Hoeflea sp. YIM 152468]
MTNNPIAAVAASILALGLTLGVTPAMAAKMDVTIGMQLEPPNLDPTGGAAAAIDEVVYANVFEGLTRFGADGSILPALAHSWEISEDGLTYTFKLHQGVKFHDGSDFDAEDVKFSLDRARADESTNAQKALFADIASVEVVDPATVKVTLSKPNGSFLFNMAWGDAVIVAPETAADNAAKPVGTGPFVFAEWVKGDRVDLTRNPDYWGDAVKLDHVTFKFISDPTAAFAAMMAGDIDAYPAFPAPENLVQFEADSRFLVINGSSEGETILAMNNKKPPLDNILVRQAIAHAIDRQAIIDGAMFGYGTPIGTHFAPHNPAYVDLTAQSAHDPEQSRALLAEAGVSDLTLSLKLPPPSYARRGGEIVAAQLREVGINVDITNVEWAQWLEDVFKAKNFDLTIVSHTEPMDIGIYARDDYYFQYGDPEFKAIMADLDKATDPAKRTELMQAAQKKIADDYVNAYLFQLARAGVINAKLKGIWPNSPTQANDMTGVYWEE